MEPKTLCNYLFCFIFCSAYHLANKTTIIIIIIITRLRSTGLSTLKKEEKKAFVWTFGLVNNTMKYIEQIMEYCM